MSGVVKNVSSGYPQIWYESSIHRPRMPREFASLVMPSQLGMPMVAPVDKPPKKTRKERREARLAKFGMPSQQEPEFLAVDDNDELIEINNLPESDQPPRKQLQNRYIPQFDTKTNRCWWYWVPYELNEDGKEVYDFEYESDRAWASFHRENARREYQQKNWWNENPQF